MLIPAHSQEALEARRYVVEVSATVGSAVTLSWPPASDATTYYIYRKAKSETEWASRGNADAESEGFTDMGGIPLGTEWEYKVHKITTQDPNYSGYGYIYVGNRARPIVNRGKIILVVDNTYVASLARELSRLENDLRGDGWTVIRHNVPRAPDTHPFGNATEAIAIRNFIKTAYHQDPANVKAVLLFGRVPVFRSGRFFPDGHDDNPRAFPADAFYGDVTPNSLVTGFTPGILVNNLSGWRGMRFTVGTAPLQVQALGRMFTNGNVQTHKLRILKPVPPTTPPTPPTIIATVDWTPAGGLNRQIKYMRLATPVTLLANTEYYLASEENNGGDPSLSFSTVVTTSGAATVSSAVYSLDGLTWTPISTSGHTYGPLGLLYTGAEQWSDGAGLWTDTAEDAGGGSNDFPDAGDGIYDQSTIPSDVELMVGRVDLAHLSGIVRSGTPPTELQLLRQYLNKNHDFRQKKGVFVNDIPRRGLVASVWGADIDGSLHEAPAASGYRNFAPFFGSGPTQIITKSANNETPADQRWISELKNNSYLWAFGAGGGDHYKIAQMGTTFDGDEYRLETPDVYEADPRVVFTMLFGSGFVEWDVPDLYWPGNLMRAMLAAPNYTLTCSWAGRPHHYYHHMGLGETIGYGIRISQTNNNTLYQHAVGLETRGVHIGLMGDPTLRMHPVAPPSFVPGAVVQTGPGGVTLNWIASTDTAIQGYYLYKSSTPPGVFTRVPATGNPLITGTTYTDTTATSGRPTYMLRAVKLETTAGTGSSTYSNLSQGVFLNGTWVATGPLATPRSGHTATLLSDGKVLLAAGYNGTSGSLASAERYDSGTGTFTGAGAMIDSRHDHTATLLPNGKVLVAGGLNEISDSFRNSAELYDPVQNTWVSTGPLNTARGGHTATLLKNGKVLVAAGQGNTVSYLTSAEIYNPDTGTWTATGSVTDGRFYHAAAPMHNGKVLVMGGLGASGFSIASAEEYDPAAGVWTAAGAMSAERTHCTATLLPDGKVLVAGGYAFPIHTSADLYNPTVRTWAATGPLTTPRFGHAAVLLANGKVLVAGGVNEPYLASAELYDLGTGTWAATGPLATARVSNTAILLTTGRVLFAATANETGWLTSAELYDP